MINVGVIGLGFMGVTHIKAYQKIDGVRIGAICDAVRLPKDGVLAGISGNIAEHDAVRLDMTQVKASSDFKELLANPDIQLVDICVPTSDHPKVAIAALKAAKHVVCEKPLARTSALARDIVTAAGNATSYFLPAMCMRFWPGWAWLRDAVQDNRFGRAIAARFRRVSAPPGWSRNVYFKGSESGGALLDLHIHDTDFVQFLFGRPKRVSSTGVTRFSGAIDHVVTQYQVEGGASVSAEGSWIMPEGYGFNMAYTVIFEKATADFDLARGADALKVFEEGQPPRVVATAGDGYVGELSYLVDCIRNGRPPTVVSARDALSAVEICEAEERSVRSGQWESV
jgi:predicted dehydrogenase